MDGISVVQLDEVETDVDSDVESPVLESSAHEAFESPKHEAYESTTPSSGMNARRRARGGG
jgi:hypothetical protein